MSLLDYIRENPGKTVIAAAIATTGVVVMCTAGRSSAKGLFDTAGEFLCSEGGTHLVKGVSSASVNSTAGRVLSDPEATEAAKTIAASILGQISKG